MNALLIPVSWLYAAGIVLRNKFFDWGILQSVAVGVPTIAVGNLTMGGTGKTPLVEFLVAYCRTKGTKVAVVSRGYGRGTKGVVVVSDGATIRADALQGGDEALQVAKKFPGIVVVVGERRLEAASVAVKQLGAHVVVMDDAFQHRYVKRDLDIVVLDGQKPLSSEFMIPAGRRREPIAALRRAHVVALSKIRSPGQMTEMEGFVKRWVEKPVVGYHYSIEEIVQLPDGKTVPKTALQGKRAVIFSGIGDNASFAATVGTLDCEIVADMGFRDHHIFSERDIREIIRVKEERRGEVFVLTEKDAMRLYSNADGLQAIVQAGPVLCPVVKVEFSHGEDRLLQLVDACLGGVAA
jgi:tetraacyldisaccharide 4'-kinase